MLARKVSTTLKELEMVRPGERVLVGLSGGPDSVALTHVLFELRETAAIELEIAHFHHGLRTEADADESFCRTLAGELGLPFVSGRADVAREAKRHRRSLEEEGRILRYAFFETQARRRRCDRIAVGHTMDDQAETVLLRLARGASTKGLASIHPVAGARIRPLIERRRHEILDYLHERELSYLDDASNRDRRFMRNRVRHDVIPLLTRALNPRLVEALAGHAAIARDDEDYLENAARDNYSRLARRETDGVRLDASELHRLHPAMRRRVVRRAAFEVKGDVRNLSRRHIEDVLALLGPRRSGKESHLPGLVVERSFDELWIRPGSGRMAPGGGGNVYNGFEYRLPVPSRFPIRESGGLLTVFEGSRVGQRLPRAAAGASVDIAVDGGTELRVRSPRPADRFRPLGAPGTKSLARYLMERKVARRKRRQVPLVVRTNDGSDEILWVAGHSVSESARFRTGRRRLHLEWVSA